MPIRTRFYPTSGGSYANAFREVCPIGPAATNVISGTKYRNEYPGPGDWSFWILD